MVQFLGLRDMKRLFLFLIASGLYAQNLISPLYCPDTSTIPNVITCSTTILGLGSSSTLAQNPLNLTSIIKGFSLIVPVANTNTGPVTLNINQLTPAVNVTKNGTTSLTSGDIVVGGSYLLTFDGTEFVISQNLSAGGGGPPTGTAGGGLSGRSEERRVGKECRS